MSATRLEDGTLTLGGIPLDRVIEGLRRLEPGAGACWVYDLDEIEARARRFQRAFAALDPLIAYALKANALPAILERLCGLGLGAESGSLGELECAAAAGCPAGRRILNGNGRTAAEAEWAARHGMHSINADSVEELDLLDRAAAREGATLRVALRVNPGIETAGHEYVATGHEDAKFGIEPAAALAAWGHRARWAHLRLDGIHVHVGSQLEDPRPLEEMLRTALDLARESARRGAPLGLVNLGGGFGVDYSGRGIEFPLQSYAADVAGLARDLRVNWVFEPGRWLVAPAGVLLSEVLWLKTRGARRFAVLAAGMNDLIRPALYGAPHRIVPVRPRAGDPAPVTVVGPVCESADVFASEIPLPPLEPGDLVAILDAGAYGASMASNYNGRGRLAELVASRGTLTRARAGESCADLAARNRSDAVEV
jgi:diaminopimelate decarboxylase